MHQISPYSIRCFNQGAEGPLIDKYYKLEAIGQYDLYKITKAFVGGAVSSFTNLADAKQIYRFSEVEYQDKWRLISGWLEVGSYGIKSEIIDTVTGAVDFHKAEKNADVLKHYFCIFLPNGCNEGIALVHSYRGTGIKTILHDGLQKQLNESVKIRLQMNPLSYEAALAEWQEAEAKELKVTKFGGVSDLADKLSGLGHSERELIIKAPKKGSFGKLKQFFVKDSEQYNVVEVLSPLGSQIKTIVDLGGRKRTFVVGHNVTNSVCDIDLDDSVKLDGGVPKRDSIHAWAIELLREYSEKMYPGLEVLS